MKARKYYIARTLDGGYGIGDITSPSPWPTRFNLTKNEARNWVRKLNSRKFKFTWWTNQPIPVKGKYSKLKCLLSD